MKRRSIKPKSDSDRCDSDRDILDSHDVDIEDVPREGLRIFIGLISGSVLLSTPSSMLFPLLALAFLFPRPVVSVFQLISYSYIHQCGPFNVSFFGGSPPAALPLTLTVLPFNSTALVYTIPQSAWDNSTASGSYVAFLPLPQGVSLMASLDDAFGNSAALASEVIHILPSDNASCISTTANATTQSVCQLLDATVSQCLPFSVACTASSLDSPLSARAFIPADLSFGLQRTSSYSSQGIDIFTFVMSVTRGFQVALLFDDDQGNIQVSGPFSVAGGESNPTKCLENTSTASTRTVRSSLSRSALLSAFPHSRLIRSQVCDHCHCCLFACHCYRRPHSRHPLHPP